jgi:ribosomal 30S subunit maturation factor RimM
MKQINLTEIGFIRKANGFKGEVILALHSFSAEDVAGSRFLFLDMDGSKVPFLVESLSDETGNVVVKFEDVNSHEAATALAARKVFLPSDELGEDYSEENLNHLLGYSVIDKQKGLLGTVKSVSEMQCPGSLLLLSIIRALKFCCLCTIKHF